MSLEKNVCEECGSNNMLHDESKGEHNCGDCGLVKVDNIDRSDIVQFMNNEGTIERTVSASVNDLGGDVNKTWRSVRDGLGKPVTMNSKTRSRNRQFERNARSKRTALRTHVERRIDSPSMPGGRIMKTTAKKVLSQTHSTEEHKKRMDDPKMKAAMEKVNGGKAVKLPLNQSRHSQKTGKDSVRNGDYTTRMVTIASMNVAARMMGVDLNTKQLAADMDVDHDHVMTESKNIVRYLNIVWEAERMLNDPSWRMPLHPGNLALRDWSEEDIRTAIDAIRPDFEDNFGTINARTMITELWAMIEQARDHQYLAGENIRLVTAGLAVRSVNAINPNARLKSKISRWLGIRTSRMKRLEKQYGALMDSIFDAHHDEASA
jgi:transcription initiation factor TFIIIB Brf1 subunit/transcription initiation factor TFIIB